jgi:hypothetical protein
LYTKLVCRLLDYLILQKILFAEVGEGVLTPYLSLGRRLFRQGQ